ncbi:MAG: class I SAM-dependent methyltransferase [Deltaproteobacteria bacterium]|nr:class I SAM-dependent methyltransferase [Deltaproteobacteria bacterium]
MIRNSQEHTRTNAIGGFMPIQVRRDTVLHSEATLPGTGYPAEILARFSSHAVWKNYFSQNKFINTPEYLAALVDVIRRQGFHCPFHLRHVAPDEIQFGPNYREGLCHGGLNSRQRAVWLELSRFQAERPDREMRIYAPEAVTDFALLLRGRYAKFIGSEYAPSPKDQAALYPIRHENLQKLSFPDGAFDAVVVNDVLEHVPDVDLCLREMARILRPDGALVTTFPFAMGNAQSIIKARLTESGIEHLDEPQYHGNPVDPKGSLAFEIPGWNILERAKESGFSTVEMVYETSLHHGILGGGFSGIFTMVARR